MTTCRQAETPPKTRPEWYLIRFPENEPSPSKISEPPSTGTDSMHRMNLTVLGCGVWVIAALASCAPPIVRVHGLQPLNVNNVNESTPVAVRFYQLTDDNAFLTAPFENLWTDAPKSLGGNLVGPVLVRTVFPGTPADEPVVFELTKREDSTHFIGVLALYRAGDGHPRQAVIPIDQLNDGVVMLQGYGVRFVTDAEAKRERAGTPTEQPKEEPKPEQQSTAGGEPESSANGKPAKTNNSDLTPDDDNGTRK